MKKQGAFALILVVTVLLATTSLAVAGELRNVKVTTSGSVDCSSPKAIAEAVFVGKTEEEKVLSFWHWYRRVMWHYKGRCRDLGDSVIGGSQPLCGSQRALQVMFFKAAGYRTRGCSAGVKGFGHSFLEVFYDKRWHAMDAMTGFYVYSRTKPRHILSHAEMKADPSLIRKAVEENRVPKMFLACAREPEIEKDKDSYLPWSNYHPVPQMIEFFAEGIQNGRVSGVGKDYGSLYIPDRMNLNLRPGESVIRTWDFEPVKFLARRAKRGDGPTGFHRCGLNDEFDTINFPYWEPYLKKNVFTYKKKDGTRGTIKRCYRYFTAGRFDRRLSAAKLLAAASSSKGIKIDGDALVAEDGKSGVLEIKTLFPYRILGAEVTLDYSRPAATDSVDLHLLPWREKKKRSPLKIWSASKTNKVQETAEFGSWMSRYKSYFNREFTLRLKIGGAARLRSALLSTIFAHNSYSGPYLVPGLNKVTVTVDNPEELAKGKLVVIYKYQDGKDWKDEHVVEKVIDRSPTEFEIQVKGPKHPRMRSVRVEVRR